MLGSGLFAFWGSVSINYLIVIYVAQQQNDSVNNTIISSGTYYETFNKYIYQRAGVRTVFYAIGLKDGDIEGYNVRIPLPDDGWETVKGQTDCLKAMYDKIYQNGRLQYEIEMFYEDGTCEISYYRI